MLDRIFNQIAKADFIIADMSKRNPNVFYEVGYAHALDKPVILITDNADDIPFDLKHRPHIIYDRNNLTGLRENLAVKVKHYAQKGARIHESNLQCVDVYLNGEPLKPDTIIPIKRRKPPGQTVHVEDLILNFAFQHNDPSFKHSVDFIPSFTAKDLKTTYSSFDPSVLPDSILLFKNHRVILSPGSWDSAVYKFKIKCAQKRDYECKLYIEGDSETISIPFTLNI